MYYKKIACTAVGVVGGAISTFFGGWSAALADGDISATDIREDWREEIVRRAAAASASADTYTREALEAMTNADLEIILAGMGISANMTKANMVTLILAMQEEAVM